MRKRERERERKRERDREREKERERERERELRGIALISLSSQMYTTEPRYTRAATKNGRP
jgi:hypothetical protein